MNPSSRLRTLAGRSLAAGAFLVLSAAVRAADTPPERVCSFDAADALLQGVFHHAFVPDCQTVAFAQRKAPLQTEVPDRARSYRDCITTMRYNCVTCHSQTLFGASTVFSLGRQRVEDPREQFAGGRILRPASAEGRYIRVSEFHRRLQTVLGTGNGQRGEGAAQGPSQSQP